ncbi:hypothetical protein OROHE_016733 [Orobanche hederae]
MELNSTYSTIYGFGHSITIEKEFQSIGFSQKEYIITSATFNRHLHPPSPATIYDHHHQPPPQPPPPVTSPPITIYDHHRPPLLHPPPPITIFVHHRPSLSAAAIGHTSDRHLRSPPPATSPPATIGPPSIT